MTIEAIETLAVSVPFRGSCSEMAIVNKFAGTIRLVSVPFRGSCSEIQKLSSGKTIIPLTGFRPLSGFVF